MTGIKVVRNLTLPENLTKLIRGANILSIPTNAGWTETVTGSGFSGQEISRLYCNTGVTVSSSALQYCVLVGFAQGTGSYNTITWDKKLYLIFLYFREVSDTEALGRVQVKESNAIGALGAKGIGLRASNLALWGESYGTVLGEVDLGVTLVTEQEQLITIIHTPAVSIEWYVNGVLKGTQSTAAKIPSGVAGATSYMVHSCNKSAATTTGLASSQLVHPKVWQAR